VLAAINASTHALILESNSSTNMTAVASFKAAIGMCSHRVSQGVSDLRRSHLQRPRWRASQTIFRLRRARHLQPPPSRDILAHTRTSRTE
jgi:hypothetical protein